MHEFMIKETDSIYEYDYIIYPSSYINPLSEIKHFEKKLKEKGINHQCTLLFDLLPCNGDNFNRFAKAYYDGEKIVRSSIEVVKVEEKELEDMEY